MGVYNNDPLFTAIITNDQEEIKRLKEQGAVLSDNVKNMLSIKRFDLWDRDADRHEIDSDFQCAVRPMSAGEFIKTIRALRKEIALPLFFMPAIRGYIKNIMYEDGVWECVLDCFDHKMNKAKTMREIIKQNRADLLALCAKHGWLKQPKKRDEVIEFANANGKTECEAFLLDFKNRTADLAAEREKADKEAERLMNAAPDSVMAMKQLWSFKKQEDGTLVITGYKGTRTEVIVPERIGKNVVTAIGDSAFCPFAPRITPEIKSVREAITRITLPDTVREIGHGTFWSCKSLVSVNIPEGVERIRQNTFAECHNLKKITIPSSIKAIDRRAFFGCDSLKLIELREGVEKIGESAFAMCRALRVLVLPASLKHIWGVVANIHSNEFTGVVAPRGSFAESYCKEKNIPCAEKYVEVDRGSSKEEYCKNHKIPYIYKEDTDE